MTGVRGIRSEYGQSFSPLSGLLSQSQICNFPFAFHPTTVCTRGMQLQQQQQPPKKVNGALGRLLLVVLSRTALAIAIVGILHLIFIKMPEVSPRKLIVHYDTHN